MPDLDHYNILICPTDTYYLQAMVVMQSALLNCEKNVHFYVLHSDLTSEHEQCLQNFIDQYALRITLSTLKNTEIPHFFKC